MGLGLGEGRVEVLTGNGAPIKERERDERLHGHTCGGVPARALRAGAGARSCGGGFSAPFVLLALALVLAAYLQPVMAGGRWHAPQRRRLLKRLGRRSAKCKDSRSSSGLCWPAGRRAALQTKRRASCERRDP